jgi:methanethiol oxidase
MSMRPDPTFHASPKLAMEAPAEEFAYTLLLSPDFSQPDALAVIDVKPGSPTYSPVVHTVPMPNKGDEFTTSGGMLAHRHCPHLAATLSWSGVT